ncbi:MULTISPECIES: hypothetical protein [unclassified Streptomyces]|uniref:hypothetical protein n=1 Tax=unclassified Streptomyces TaxID=2593676 RepID=UPI00093EA656|nr:hypothetical protein [Streptomyces sp. TSRI0107]OKJ88430.1 hypothetical protein AMK31_07990 [Streptomyces sp. TSRI0107]
MSDDTTAPSDLAAQYAARIADDLQSNVKEQERVSAEIEVLQSQLAKLRHDHTVLVTMQQALGLPPSSGETATAVGTAAGTAAVPAPRKKNPASGKAKQTRAKKTAAASRGTKPGRQATGKGTATRRSAAAGKGAASGKTADEPTLVALVRGHLTETKEPRSAAEVAAALEQAHPERSIKTTVVRTALEGLVAKSQAQRSKQGNSVFYSAPDAPVEEPQPQAPADQAD